MSEQFLISVDGLAVPVLAFAEYEEPDRASGVTGGWFMVEALIRWSRPAILLNSPKRDCSFLMDRKDFEALFGSKALRVAEENISDMAYERTQERDRGEVEA